MNMASKVEEGARDAAAEAREGVREMREAAASGDLQRDLQALRDDFARLAEQVGAIFANRGNAAWEHARSSVDGVVADAQGKGREAADALREVSDNFAQAIDESLKERPYTTLAIVAGLGFLFGVTWRR
jgi:ElaB/YqjD/DUF883 family membrane-anchored ribosome-binding protein